MLSSASPDPASRPSPEIEEWVNERSREELSELLLKAEKAIRDRENELGLTSAVCKNLYQENVNLKTKHDALISRLPPSQPMSPIGSPSPSSLSLSSPFVFPPSVSASSTLSHPPSPSVYRRHARRISVTPSEISRLADQNSELMLKLERLEVESAQADQAGRRQLRKLEREIQLLKDELERTQARSAELEEKAGNQGAEVDEEEREVKKREREEKLKGIRAKTVTEEGEEEVRDFAPGGALSANSTPNVTPSSRRIRRDFSFPPRSSSSSSSTPTASPTVAHFPHHSDNTKRDLDEHFGPGDADEESYFARPAEPSPDSLHESALISQLLAKIRELEQTNAQISEQQQRASGRVRAAHCDAAKIRRLYEALGDESVDVQIVENDGEEGDTPDAAERDTVRFRSLRRTLDAEGEPAQFGLDVLEFERGIKQGMHSTSRGDVETPSRGKSRHRRSVVGLFEDALSPTSLDGLSTTVAGSSPPRAASPSPSVMLPDLSFPSTEVDLSAELEAKHTLGSELGSEYGDDLAGGGGVNHHLRTTSLYGLSQFSVAGGEEGDSVPADSLEVPESSSIGRRRGSLLAEEAIGGGSVQHAPKESKRESMRLRNRLLSQTVRARTSQWVDGRFKGTLRSQTDSALDMPKPSPLRREPSSSSTIVPVSRTASLSKLFEGAVGTVFQPASSRRSSSPYAEEKEPEASESAEADKSVLKTDEEKKGVVAVVLDLWLWLQFIIIILVFLWAMAKRGPRNVLEEAERRRGTATGQR